MKDENRRDLVIQRATTQRRKCKKKNDDTSRDPEIGYLLLGVPDGPDH